jgi:hypothetical protein
MAEPAFKNKKIAVREISPIWEGIQEFFHKNSAKFINGLSLKPVPKKGRFHGTS